MDEPNPAPHPLKPHKKIISVYSVNAQNGSSLATANLAAQLAVTGLRVGMAETNFQAPGLVDLLGLDERKVGKTINDLLYANATIGEIGFPLHKNTDIGSGLSELKEARLWLFPASSKGYDLSQIIKEGIDFNRLNESLQLAIKEFDLDYLLIDTRPGFEENTLLTFATSDLVLAILRPTKRDLLKASVIVDIMRSLDIPNFLMIINKALPKYDLAEIERQITAELDSPVAAALPMVFELMEDENNGLFSLQHPNHEWSKGIKRVAQAILGLIKK